MHVRSQLLVAAIVCIGTPRLPILLSFGVARRDLLFLEVLAARGADPDVIERLEVVVVPQDGSAHEDEAAGCAICLANDEQVLWSHFKPQKHTRSIIKEMRLWA